jgi:hypothetical protein
VLGDHPKRGLVVAVPPGTPDREVLGWLLAAAKVVARVPIPDRWKATIHDP